MPSREKDALFWGIIVRDEYNISPPGNPEYLCSRIEKEFLSLKDGIRV